MIVVFTGNGKGKTTASLGQVFRVLGHNKPVLMIQFIKGPWISGEDLLVKKLNVQSKNLLAQGVAPDEIFKGGSASASGEQGKWTMGNDSASLEALYNFEIRKMGKGFVGILGDSLPREEHEKAAQDALDMFVEEKKSGKWHMIVLDEINVALSLNLLKPENVLEAVRDFPEDNILVMTGRGAAQEIIDVADLATEMREIKHPFNDDRWAKKTIEF